MIQVSPEEEAKRICEKHGLVYDELPDHVREVFKILVENGRRDLAEKHAKFLRNLIEDAYIGVLHRSQPVEEEHHEEIETWGHVASPMPSVPYGNM